MRTSAKWLIFTVLGLAASIAAQEPGAVTKPSPVPPTVRLAMTSLKPEATFAHAGERQFVVTADGIWVANRSAGTLARIDAKSNKPEPSIVVGKEPCASVVSAFGGVWVPLCGVPGLARVPTASQGPPGAAVPQVVNAKVSIRTAGPIVSGTGSIWMITDRAGILARIDPGTNAAVAEVTVPAGASALAFGDGDVWVTSAIENTVTRVHGTTNVIVETIKVGRAPSAIAFGVGGLWTFNGGDGTVSRIDTKTNKVAATIKTGITGNGGLAVGEGSVWLSAPGTPLARIDPATNHLRQVFTGPGGGAIAVGHKSLWVAATPTETWRIDPRRVEATSK